MGSCNGRRGFGIGVVALGFCVAVLGLDATATHAVTIQWVTVRDPGNTADTNGYGAVADPFRIMKYEWTNSQYVEFLNAVDPNGTNPNRIYDNGMSGGTGGIVFTTGNPVGSKYAAKTDMGNKPVNYVNWWDAARVANWLHNGANSNASTETGAYTLNNATSGNAPAVNSDARFYIPTENQWYKAAYYSPNAGGVGVAGYWLYATQSDTAPGTTTGSSPNQANYNNGGGPIDVGSYTGSASFYGTFDQVGNVTEWNDLNGASGSSTRGLRGGRWFNEAAEVSANGREVKSANLSSEFTSSVGFRLAAVPEPSTWAMGLAGIASAGWGAFRRRWAR